MVVNKHFINTDGYISKSKRCYNAKPSAYYFYMRKKITLNFHIYISVPLKFSYRQSIESSETLFMNFLIYAL